MNMRIATWNVNSVKQRTERLLPWLVERQPDVVCLQETKLTDVAFDELLGDDLAALGYQYAHHGYGQWNGVALLSRVGLVDVEKDFEGQPGFAGKQESRAVSATCGGIRVHSLYVPNGRELDAEHYVYKLHWLMALAKVVERGPADVALCGDMNVAPADVDVFDPQAFVGHTHVSQPERDAITALGLIDLMRQHWPAAEHIYSYWDYRAGMFQRDQGMRIDLILGSEPLAGRVAAAWVDRAARKGTRPSDHAPVIVDLDVAPDGDVGPMVPPPSKPVRKAGAKLPQDMNGS